MKANLPGTDFLGIATSSPGLFPQKMGGAAHPFFEGKALGTRLWAPYSLSLKRERKIRRRLFIRDLEQRRFWATCVNRNEAFSNLKAIKCELPGRGGGSSLLTLPTSISKKQTITSTFFTFRKSYSCENRRWQPWFQLFESSEWSAWHYNKTVFR